ncbi:MAG: DUF3836 domain-containing protein [Tannerellaceae bacterium]|jgi:hypothetical protein|nr:DUF3836 domain-containing protein [Tannerellaceae bacterium]
MKKNHYKKNLLTVAFLLCLSLNSFSKEKQTLFYYSNLGAQELMRIQTISIADKPGTYLTPHLKYVFTYDEYNRVVKKEAYGWNLYAGSWECSSQLNFTYSTHTITIEYARWNHYRNIYDAYTERAVYTLNNESIDFYSYYKKEKPADDWKTVAQLTEISSGTIRSIVKLF